MVDPGDTLRGTVTLTANATDPDIASIAFQYRPGGGSGPWTTIGTDTELAVVGRLGHDHRPDGTYDLRAVVTDTRTTSHLAAADEGRRQHRADRVDHDPAAAATLTGSVTYSVSATDATSGVASVSSSSRRAASPASRPSAATRPSRTRRS